MWFFRKNRLSIVFSLFLITTVLVGYTIAILVNTRTAEATGDLQVEINAAYNLIVDSNATSPSTYAPSVATVIGRFCNNGDTDLTNVYGYIGNYIDGSNDTPGIYPARTVDASFTSEHPSLDNAPGSTYSFTHVGGRTGTRDATRYIGTLSAGECSVQYWHFTYPQCENDPGGTADTPPCDYDPTWGDSVKPGDDLWLEFDIWATGNDAGTPVSQNQTWRMTTRNEISAMANKIRPNPDGLWFNTDTSQVSPGKVITTNGVLYELGNIRQGFDNDGDFEPDYNAWLQPFGDPSYDPSCFRLIRTTSVLTVSRSAGQPDLIIRASDQNVDPKYGGPLYFSNLPSDNSGVRGEVRYAFLALNGPCTIPISPYQEVASGFDNEKFNGDFGTGVPPTESLSAQVSITKTGDTTQTEGAIISYQMEIPNASATEDAGLFLSSGDPVDAPVVFSDTVPVGLEYVGSSAGFFSTYGGAAAVLYSIDGGDTFTTTDPGDTLSAAGSEVILQWRLNEEIPAGGSDSATATFQARIPSGHISGGGDAFLENCGSGSFGDAAPFDNDCTTTLVEGTATIGDLVWQDDDGNGIKDAGESGIDGVQVSLYWDKNGDGALGSDDMLISTQDSSGTADPNYDFTQLPAGDYLVVVDSSDAQIPTGFSPTTATVFAVTLTAGEDYNDADFGFGPVLEVGKDTISLDPAYVGEEDVTFRINLRNTRPGDGTADGSCTYTVWATIDHPDSSQTPPGGNSANAQWSNTSNALNAFDGQFSVTDLSDNPDQLGLSGFNTGGQGNITSVEFLLYTKEIREFKGGDQLEVQVYHSNGTLGSPYTFDGASFFTNTAGSEYTIRQDITSLRTWAWSDFTTNITEMQLLADKGSGPGSSGDVGVDAAAYVITTDQTCGGADSTIATLPLTDTYDADLLQFVSADPDVSSSTTSGSAPSTVGTLAWNNLGPLYAGGTETITVTFKALATTASTVDTAEVADAKFGNGHDVNDDSDTATVGINTSGSITGTVWAESTTGNSWNGATGYDGSDSRISGASVDLYACYAVINGVSQPLTPTTADDTSSSCSANGGTWQLVTTQQTDDSGDYLFSGLRPGYYNVKVDETTLPTGFQPSGSGERTAEADPAGNGAGSACGTCDGQWNTDGATLSTFNDVASGDNVTAVSFGYRDGNGNGAITGYVWNDTDGNGLWDTGEAPISSTNVYLCTTTPCNASTAGAVLQNTDSNGFYSYGDLAPDTYYVGVADPSSMSQSGDPDEAGPCATCDGQTNAITVTAREVKGPYDFGYTGGLTIGDTVYVDWDGDGTQDSGEEGISGVVVRLYRDLDGDGVVDSNDTLLDTQTTDAAGVYQFNGLAGDGNAYIVRVAASSIPADHMQTADPDEAGTCTTCNGKSGVTLTTTSVDTVDFGYQPQGFGSIGDYVWLDDDADGAQDGDESGLSSVTVDLYEDSNGDGTQDSSDALVATTTTDSSGIYTFTNLIANGYWVEVDTSSSVIDNNGYKLTTSSNPVSVTLSAGEAYEDADFGFATALIGDFIWQDNDGDGLQDTNDPGIAGVTVELLSYTEGGTDNDWYDPGTDTLGGVIATTTTDANGRYQFGGLDAGNYVVRVASSNFNSGQPLETYTLTGDPDAYSTNSGKSDQPCDTADTDYENCDNLKGSTLTLGQEDRSYDFGYEPEGVIGDYVWNDADGDGVQDSNEVGISGVGVNLCTSSPCSPASSILTATTDADGLYSFGNLNNNAYYVSVDSSTLPSGLTQTHDKDGTLDHESTYTVSSGSSSLTEDFGYQYSGSGSISGAVFYDNGNDGGTYQSGTDDPFDDIVVILYKHNSDGTIDKVSTATTDGNGAYSFSGIPENITYTVAIQASNPKISDLTQTADPDDSDNNCGNGGCNNYNQIVNLTGSSANNDYGYFADNVDCGDLPESAPNYSMTTLNSTGACHGMSGPHLGANVDADSDGQPVAEAGSSGGGDDNDGTNDDDGVERRSDFWTPGATVALTVTVTGSNGYLVGWFDWNQDGDFNDTGEVKVFGSVANGDNVLSLTIPGSGYSTGDDVYTRFRLYDGTPASYSSSGTVSGGEVEDYYWAFGPTAVSMVNMVAGSASTSSVVGLLVLVGLGFITIPIWRRRYGR